MTPAEQAAITAAEDARVAVSKAIAAYQEAGFGSHVTQPLSDALSDINFSIREIQS